MKRDKTTLKKILLGCPALFVAAAVFAGSYVTTVTSNEVAVLAPVVQRSVSFPARVVSTAYTNLGQIVSIDGIPSQHIMLMSTGTTSSASLTFVRDTDITDNDITWRPVPRSPRNRVIFQNLGTNPIYLRFNSGLSSTAGIRLSANVKLEFDTLGYAPQGKVFANTIGYVTSVLSITEDW